MRGLFIARQIQQQHGAAVARPNASRTNVAQLYKRQQL